MARATHLTIGTADRIRLDASCNDYDGENEVRQEVQVSVTYALDETDTDLTALAKEMAAEVQQAHEAAWHRIGAFCIGAVGMGAVGMGAFGNNAAGSHSFRSLSPGRTCHQASGRAGNDPMGYEPIGNDEEGNGSDGWEPENEGDEDDPDGDPEPVSLSPDPSPVNPPLASSKNGWYMPGGSHFVGISRPEHSPAPESNTEPQSNTEPLTGPQRILIRSRAKKIGLSTRDLDTLLYQQFKVWRVERLTKAQATSLLDALDRDLKERDLTETKSRSDVSPLVPGGDYAA